MYVGESKIIRNVATCFAVGYTAGWALQDTHGLLPSYHCRAGVTLIVHFCRECFAINMDTPHLIWTPKKAEGSDPFLWAEGVPGAEMHRRMSVQYGNGVMSEGIVCEWIERFENGSTIVKRGEGTGHQSTSITDADAERVYGMILQNRRVTVDEVAHQLQIIRDSAYEIIHNRLAFHKVCA
jgi:hypothetical protein